MPPKFNVPVQTVTGMWASRHTALHLLAELRSSPEKGFLAPAFIAAVASGIEGRVNSGFVDFFHLKVGRDYHRYVDPYLRLRFEERLEQLPLIVTNFKYRLDRSNPRVKLVGELFDLRNRLLHIKQHWLYPEPKGAEATASVRQSHRDRIDKDPYSEPGKLKLKLPDLARYMRLHEKFTLEWFDIAFRAQRRNFNPRGWLTPL